MAGPMRDSTRDMIAFVGTVLQKNLSVPQRYSRRFGEFPRVPDLIVKARATLKEVAERIGKGDLRHTDMELQELVDLAQWLVDLHARTNGNVTGKTVVCDPERMAKSSRILA